MKACSCPTKRCWIVYLSFPNKTNSPRPASGRILCLLMGNLESDQKIFSYQTQRDQETNQGTILNSKQNWASRNNGADKYPLSSNIRNSKATIDTIENHDQHYDASHESRKKWRNMCITDRQRIKIGKEHTIRTNGAILL